MVIVLAQWLVDSQRLYGLYTDAQGTTVVDTGCIQWLALSQQVSLMCFCNIAFTMNVTVASSNTDGRHERCMIVILI